MKRVHTGLWVLALAMALFFGAGEVRAYEGHNCSSDNQELFAISSDTNAHGEVWNGAGNYPFEICYNDSFSDLYPSGSNSHNPSGLNTILRLSGQINAHAENLSINTDGYQNVSYGDLRCFLQSARENCNETILPDKNSYCLIASISNNTNAHIALTNYYDYSICCKSASSSCRCDYDGTCDEAQGENPINCPGDCEVICGNGKLEVTETCDCGRGNTCYDNSIHYNLGGKTCADYAPDSPFASGNLECSDTTCQFDTSNCNLAECSDTLDNENGGIGDGATDFPADFSCTGPGDDDETNPKAQCQNENDDDGDDTCDWNGCDGIPYDEGCANSQDNSENVCGNERVEPDAGGVSGAGEQCDCGTDGCTPAELGDSTCESTNYGTGTGLSCTDECTFDPSDCEGYDFCRDKEPFEMPGDEAGVVLSPSSCQDYNLVYPGNTELNNSLRNDSCTKSCVPGTTEPVNNGYGNSTDTLTAWGCGFDENADTPTTYDGECNFWYNATANPGGICRLDYNITQRCTQDNPFRRVNVTAYLFPSGGTGTCNAGCGVGATCEANIMCPRVIQLPLIGALGLALAVIIIALVYAYSKRKK